MNKRYYIIPLMVGVMAMLGACSKNEAPATRGNELTLTAQVPDMPTIGSRVAGSTFFEPGQFIEVTITDDKSGNPVVYPYQYQASGIFKGNPAFRFDLNDNYIKTLEAIWPGLAVRSQPFPEDQSTKQAFRNADWMVAQAEAAGIMPTDKPVPLKFVRKNCMIEFELIGQNGIGVDILELTIELQVDGQAVAFDAYPDPVTGHAKLIVKPGTKVFSTDKYLIGTLRASPDTRYTMIFPATDITLQEGYRYLVTLSPQGYNMSLYPVIAGFNDADQEGIGIPFQQPVPLENGSFLIDTPLRLITMSYLMRHYTDGTTFDWPSRDYVITLAQIPQDMAARYVSLPAGLFTGTMKDAPGGNVVTSIPIEGGGELALIESQDVNP